VGRRVIRDKVQECLTQLQNDNKGNAIYLAGEPGQGKSRLLSLAEGYALRYGLKTVRSRCQPQDPPFGPFIPIYEALRSEPSSILEQALRSGGTGQIRERYPVIAAFRDVITQNSPCILIIDDIQHADSPTLELLEYLIRNTLQLANEQVVFILAEESALGGKSSSARRLCNAGPVTWFHLGPLSPPEVEELVLSILPNTPASLALAKRLHAESHGSPAFIADMLRGLVKEGLIAENNQRYTLTLDASEVTRSRLPMPVSLRAALKERLSPLSAAAMELGRTLALSRHQMDLDVLIAVAALDEDEVMEALDELVEANIVKESRTDDNEQVELNHKRFRDVFVEELDPEDLRSRHQLIGEVLELHSRHRLGDVAEQLTFHFEHAGLASKAYAYLTQTANRHLEASSFDRSLSILNRALHMEPTARSYLLLNHADQQLAQILIARARCLHHLGQWQNGWKDAQRAYQIANQTPDTRLQSQIATYLGHRLREQGDAQEAEKFLREALRKADEIGDVTLTPRPLYHLGAIMWSKGDLEQSNALWVQTLTTARASNDDWATGFGFNGLGILAICQGQSMDARRKLEQSAEIFERVGLLPPLAIARVNLAELYHSTGILKKAMAMAERTVAQATEVHHLQGIALGLAHRAQIIVDIGRLDEALDNAKEAHRIIKELNAKEDEQLALATMARVHMVREEPEEACAMLEELLPLLEHQDYEGIDPVMQAWHANVLAVLGRMDDAVAALERARAKEPLWPHIIVRRDLAVANAHMRLDQPELAQQTLQRALQRAESNGYRFFQLLAHNGLCKVSIEASARARHGRVASALARSLAANLPSNDSQSFLKRGWGQTDT